MYACIDCGPPGIAFVDKHWIHHHQLEQKELQESRELEVIEERPIESGTIMNMTK
jgi:hypothetical protein